MKFLSQKALDAAARRASESEADGNAMASRPTGRPKYTREELAWARRQCKRLGLEDPRTLLEMPYSQALILCAERGLEMVFTFPKGKRPYVPRNPDRAHPKRKKK